jgi:RimJ/RimL family protein N-acetyltransferase
MLKLETERLILIAGNVEMAEAELTDRNKLESLVGAKFSKDWPPPLNDEDSMKWFWKYMVSHPGSAGWVTWYFCLKMPDDSLQAIGNGGFKGKPDRNGTIETGYSVIENFQLNGYATEAVKELIRWAFGHSNVKKIIAQTFPNLVPSIKVLEKCGFKYSGKGYEEGTILYELLKTGH